MKLSARGQQGPERARPEWPQRDVTFTGGRRFGGRNADFGKVGENCYF